MTHRPECVPNIICVFISTSDAEESSDELSFETESWLQLKRRISFMIQAFKVKSFNIPVVHTPEDLIVAEKTLFSICQKKMKTDINETKKRFLKYNPVVDDTGIIRAKGRLGMTSLPEEAKYPILLSADHPIVRVYARYYHKKLLHQGYRVVETNIIKSGVIIGGVGKLLKSRPRMEKYAKSEF